MNIKFLNEGIEILLAAFNNLEIWVDPQKELPIRIGEREFGSIYDPRSTAIYYSTLHELEQQQFVRFCGGELYKLTGFGILEADKYTLKMND